MKIHPKYLDTSNWVWLGGSILVVVLFAVGTSLYFEQGKPRGKQRAPTKQPTMQPAARVKAHASPHQELAQMRWFDGIVYIRNNSLSIGTYIPVVREGIKSTPNWPQHIREAFYLSQERPWGELSGVLTDAVMQQVNQEPKGLAQQKKAATLFCTVFPSQPEALIACKLLWEAYTLQGLRLSAACMAFDNIKRAPTANETVWLLEQANLSFSKKFPYLHAALQAAWLTALPVGHPAKVKGPKAELDLANLRPDAAFEEQLLSLPEPNQFNDLAAGDWDTPWKKLRSLEFQMRKFYLTANHFDNTVQRTVALSTDNDVMLKEITALLREKLALARPAKGS